MVASENDLLRFESPPRTVSQLLGSVLAWLVGAGCIGLAVWFHGKMAAATFASILFELLLCAGGCALFWLAWHDSLHLRVELCASPREARCRRMNIFTSIRTHHRYPIPDDARVCLVIKEQPPSEDVQDDWPIRIDGLPGYYDFFRLGRAKNLSEGWEIARRIASFLNLPFVDDYGNAHSTRDRGRYAWSGLGPYVSRPRRRRRKRRSNSGG